MMSKNKLIIAAAGSGKTTYLLKEALNLPGKRILITTYTQSNEASIRQKIIKLQKCIPKNLTIQTWFSFLLQHGVKPYQGCLSDFLYTKNIRGMFLVNKQSGVKYINRAGRPICFSEDSDFEKYYFTKDGRIYSDKISKFIFKCNQSSDNAVIDRIARIYDYIFIDEIQDLAGYDLEIIKLLFKSSSSVLLVGDPRQVTYLTHVSRKYSKYKNGGIRDFINGNDCRGAQCEIDGNTLSNSYRNNQVICEYSSRLYPEFPETSSRACCRDHPTDHIGVFLIKEDEIESYSYKYDVVQLRWNSKINVKSDKPVMNFGESKGLTFDRVLLYPTKDMAEWIADNSKKLSDGARAKFYVALTRARYSVAIVMDYDKDCQFKGIEKYSTMGQL